MTAEQDLPMSIGDEFTFLNKLPVYFVATTGRLTKEQGEKLIRERIFENGILDAALKK